MVMGHEASGRVAAVGEGVTHLQVGEGLIDPRKLLGVKSNSVGVGLCGCLLLCTLMTYSGAISGQKNSVLSLHRGTSCGKRSPDIMWRKERLITIHWFSWTLPDY